MQILALPLIYRDPVWFLHASVYLSMKEGWAPHPDPTCAPAQLDTANAQDLAFPLLLAHLHSLHPSSLRALHARMDTNWSFSLMRQLGPPRSSRKHLEPEGPKLSLPDLPQALTPACLITEWLFRVDDTWPCARGPPM